VLSYGEKIAKIGTVYLEIFAEIRQTTTWTRNVISIDLFSVETTWPIFTKILPDIVALFNLAHTRRYPIGPTVSECQSDESGEFAGFFHKIGCYGNVPWAKLCHAFVVEKFFLQCFFTCVILPVCRTTTGQWCAVYFHCGMKKSVIISQENSLQRLHNTCLMLSKRWLKSSFLNQDNKS